MLRFVQASAGLHGRGTFLSERPREPHVNVSALSRI
jgi:hypothetical protein